MSNPIEIEISPGELIDRYSIILIKTAYIMDGNKINNIRAEKEMLTKKYNELDNPHKESQLKSLIYVNSLIWDLENEIREHHTWDFLNRKVAKTAKEIAQKNDERYQLKRSINIACGYESCTEEKSHC